MLSALSLPNPSDVLDGVLEASIIGSFTRLGPAARSRLRNWDPIDADLTDRQVVVTGGSSGLGRETARHLVELGATVHVTSRSRDRAEEAAADINRSTSGPGTAKGLPLDVADFDSIHAFITELQSATSELHVLIHNAGALTDEFQTNDNGMEMTLATHLVGPYAMTTLLRPHLAAGAKVLWMSSGGMYTQQLDVAKLEMQPGDYRGAVAYARAKRAQVELVTHLAPQWAPEVVMASVHPGWVDTDGVSQGLPGFGKVMGPLLRTVAEGADTMVWLAAGGADDAAPGQFWHDRAPRSTVYVPGTGTDDAERTRLLEWLDLQSLPAHVE
ncbi:MAG: SDR family NAD(P)-dependent oxidoreductase [Actinomycetota bacterium]